MKALFINGSPRKNGNTAQLLKRAMDGAREASISSVLFVMAQRYKLNGIYKRNKHVNLY